MVYMQVVPDATIEFGYVVRCAFLRDLPIACLSAFLSSLRPQVEGGA
jgi:hypothetical protein